jgi:hypothetical protein
MRENMMPLLPKLTETEIKLIKEATRRYDPDLDCVNPTGLHRERVIRALWLYGTTPALDLVFKLRGETAPRL